MKTPTPEQMKRYLAERGWQSVGKSDKWESMKQTEFCNDEETDTYIDIPQMTDALDYARTVRFVIESLARLLHSTVEEVLCGMLGELTRAQLIEQRDAIIAANDAELIRRYEERYELERKLERLHAAGEALIEFWDNGSAVHPSSEVVQDFRDAMHGHAPKPEAEDPDPEGWCDFADQAAAEMGAEDEEAKP